MMDFPRTFSETLTPLHHLDLDERGTKAVTALADRGFEVVAGARIADVDEISAIANEEGIIEYCPKDKLKRFGNETMMREWLEKQRGPFQLRNIADMTIAGMGWTGPEACPELPMCDTTFAERISERYAGRGLGAPFAVAIVAGTAALYGERVVGLETWGSNTAAVRSYLKAGAQLVTTKDGVRPTRRAAANEPDGKRRDVRLFMRFPAS